MSENWKVVKVGDVCVTNKRTYSLSENWDFVNYLDTGNLTQDKVNEYQKITIGTGQLPSRARRKVGYNDILYSTVRPNQLHYGIVKNIVPNMLVSTGFTVITADTEQADSDYLYYFLTQDSITETLHAIGEQSTSAYPSIKPSDIENLDIVLPSLEEQREIGRTLRVIDEKIENNKKINHHLSAPMSARSATDGSPDIRRGKRVSRSSVRREFSCTRSACCWNRHSTVSRNLSMTTEGGIKTRKERKSVLLNFGCADPPVIDRISSAPYECLNSK